MKRDLDFIREILLKIESSDGLVYPDMLVTDKHSLTDVNFHLKLLADFDYIEIMDASTISGEYYIVKRITMGGYDYLDSVRSDKVWRTVKDKLSKYSDGASSAALEVIKSIATHIITQALCQ